MASGAHAVVRVIRQKLRLRHAGPGSRELERELTIINEGDKPIREIAIVLDGYLPGLQVSDSRGATVGYLSTAEINRRGLAAEDAAQTLWLVLDVPLAPRAVTTLTLRQQEIRGGKFRGFIVKRAVIGVKHTASAGDGTVIIEVHAPPDSSFRVSRRGSLPAGAGISVKETVSYVESHGFAQFRVPEGCSVDFDYEVTPEKVEGKLLFLLWLGMSLLPLIAIMLYIWKPFQNGEYSQDYLRDISILGFSATLATVALVRPQWIRRWPFIIPLLLNGVTMLGTR